MRKLALLFVAACGGGTGSENQPNQLPVANMAAGETVVAGQALVFDGSASTDPDQDSLRFSWSFGDGGRGGAAKQAHIFAEAGTFTVTLTVNDGRGGVDGATHTVTVTAEPPPTAMVTATVRVSSPTGERIAGATVRVRGGASSTTDGGGVATVTIGAGAVQVLRVERAGFAPQTQVLDLPEADPFIEVIVNPLAPMLALDDASAGGVVSGTDGARVELPPDGLVDDSGTSVSGAVDVSMTPLDVVTDGAAFPGKFEGVDANGAGGMLMSWGTVAYSFSQEGRALNLAAGLTATVDLPVYAGLNLDGAPVAPGRRLPPLVARRGDRRLDPGRRRDRRVGAGVAHRARTSRRGGPFLLVERGQVRRVTPDRHQVLHRRQLRRRVRRRHHLLRARADRLPERLLQHGQAVG